MIAYPSDLLPLSYQQKVVTFQEFDETKNSVCFRHGQLVILSLLRHRQTEGRSVDDLVGLRFFLQESLELLICEDRGLFGHD